MAVEYFVADDPVQVFQRDLAYANRFSFEDLEANRAGRISSSQMFRLGGQAMQPLVSAVIAMGGWLIFVEVVRLLVPGFLQALLWGKGVGGGLIVTVGCAWGVLVGFLQTSRLTILLLVDTVSGVAASIQGSVYASSEEAAPMGLDRFHGEKKYNYSYVVREKEFTVSEPAHALLRSYDGLVRPRARVYYTPRSQMLLSIEPM